MKDLILELKKCSQKSSKQDFLIVLNGILDKVYNKYKNNNEKKELLNRIFKDIESLMEVDDAVAVIDLVEYELVTNFKC